MKDYSKLSQNDLHTELLQACGKGDLDLIKYLISSEDISNNPKIKHNKWEAIKLATSLGQIEVVKYFLEDIQNEYPNIVFNVSCQYGQLEILEYLFHTSEFKSDKRNLSLLGSSIAASKGHTNLLKYFLTFSEFIDSGEIKKYKYDELFVTGCEKGHVNVIDYLLDNEDFLRNVNISDMAYWGFYKACENNQMNILQYFIFEKNMEFNQHIKDYLTEKNRNDIKALFNKRELSKQLTSDLPNNQTISKKIKL